MHEGLRWSSLPGVIALLVSGMMCTLRGQSVPVYKVETHLIDTTVSVHDAEGGLIQGLSQEDFTVFEDGVPQRIRFFAHDAQLPLSIGLVIDVSGSQEKFVRAHEEDIEVFLREVLEPDDRAFAVCFGNHLRLVSDWTGKIASILSGVRSFDKGNRDFAELGPKEDREEGTALHDAVFYSITERFAEIRQRRKVLLVFSDGEENASEHDLLDSIEAAQNGNVLVYAVRYTELHHGKIKPRDRYGMRVLEHLTAATGGKAYDVQATEVKRAFAEIAGDLRSLYAVAYQSTNRTRDGSYRKIVIRVNRPEVLVRARTGYSAR